MSIKRSIRFICSIPVLFAISSVLPGCIDPTGTALNIQSESSALSSRQDSDTGTLISMSVKETEIGDDSPDPTIRIEWQHDDAKSMKKTVDALVLKLTNFLAEDLTAHVTVRFSGLMMEVAALDLGDVRLGAKSEVPLSISTDAIPMQTTNGVCQATAFMEVRGEDDYFDASGSEALFYRHLPNYKNAQVFGEKLFLKENHGKFFDIGESVRTKGMKAASAEVLGRIRNDKGIFEEVTAENRGMRHAAEGGEPIMVVHASFGSAPEDPAEELREMNNEYN